MEDVIKIVGIKSRYASRTSNTIYIKFDKILGNTLCYCTCKSGMRTCTSCSHSIAALTHIYYIRHNGPIPEIHSTSKLFFRHV